MQDITETSPRATATILGRIAADPLRLLAVSDWWHEMSEPVELLTDPEATFHADGLTMLALCKANGIAHRAAAGGAPPAFPAWLFLELYPAKP